MIVWIALFLLHIFFWFWLLRLGGLSSWAGKIILRCGGFFQNHHSEFGWILVFWGLVGSCIYFFLNLFTNIKREDEVTVFAWFSIITHLVIFICGIMSDDFQVHYFS